MPVPTAPKIYHIVHADRLPAILSDGFLWCDAEVLRRNPPGTTIGISEIKERRLKELRLASHPDLHVGDCVPFYFCPRSVMLYLIHRGNHPDLDYRGGQEFIVHLEADLNATVTWANANGRRWAFTLSNAGSRFFEDHADLGHLAEIDWEAAHARDWRGRQEGKQAEFLVEHSFPWHLVERTAVRSERVYRAVLNSLPKNGRRPMIEVHPEWYY